MAEDKPIVEDAGSANGKFTSTWKLPDGIEDHIESGLIKAAIGMAIGGAAGMLLFRAGGGKRTACVVAGLGTALGSTYERARESNQ